MTTESTPFERRRHSTGAPVSERPGPEEQTGTSGVSDRRRAELERMEAAAGTQHEAADESVPQQPADNAQEARDREASALPQDRRSSVNPDIDKR